MFIKKIIDWKHKRICAKQVKVILSYIVECQHIDQNKWTNKIQEFHKILIVLTLRDHRNREYITKWEKVN